MFRSLIALLLLSFCLTQPALAEQKVSVGNYDIHYVALNSTFLTPKVAKAYGIKRSSYLGLVNISVLDTSIKGSPAAEVELTGVANNLLDARTELKFKQIKDGSAIYYIAEVPYRDDQEINFKITVKHGNKLHTQFSFKQKFYVE